METCSHCRKLDKPDKLSFQCFREKMEANNGHR